MLVLGTVLGCLISFSLTPSRAPDGCPKCPDCAALADDSTSHSASAADEVDGLRRRLRDAREEIATLQRAAQASPAAPSAPAVRARSGGSGGRPEALSGTAWRTLQRLDRATAERAIGRQLWWDSEYRKGPDKLLLLRHRDTTSEDPFTPCDEVGVVVMSATRPNSCLVVTETSEKDGVMWFVDRHCRGKGEGRCKSGDGRLVTVGRPSVYHSLSGPLHKEKAQKLILGLFENLQAVTRELKPLLRRIARPDNQGVTVMTTNAGDLEMLLNWHCSARQHGLDTSNVLVIASDEKSRDAAREAGLAAVHSTAFGPMPQQSARAYGDGTFGDMMWMKTIAVWLVSRLGYTVLFQDADLVWFKDPWDYFKEHHAEDDIVWMDDSARSERFGPYYANSGFYLVRATPRAQQFAQEVLFHTDQIFASKSHQAVADSLLADGHSRYGLRVGILNPELFASGAYFHYRVEWVKRALTEGQLPYVFHMCWTTNKVEKLRYLKLLRWWWLKPSCLGADCCERREPEGPLAWEEYKKLRLQLDKKTVEQRMEQDAKSRRPFIPDP